MSRIATLALTGALALGGAHAALAQTQGVTDSSITVGIATDLSGPLASWGVPATNALRLRVEEFNAAGGAHGRTVDLRIEDTQYQVPLVARATQRLVQRDGVFAMLTTMGTAQALASYEITDRAGMANLFPFTGARAVAFPTHPLHVSLFVSYQDQAIGAIRYFHEQSPISTICLQTQATEYGEEVTEGVRSVSEELGIEIAMIGTHRTTETEFSGASLAIRNANCDLVYLGTSGRDTIALYTTLRQLGVTAPIVTNMVSYLPVVAQAGNGAMDGLYAVSPVFDANWTDGDAFRTEFHQAYQAAYGEAPTVQSQAGWLAADIFLRAVEAAGPELTTESLMAAIENISDYSDPFGGSSLSFSAEKRFGMDSLTMMQVQNSAWVTHISNLPY